MSRYPFLSTEHRLSALTAFFCMFWLCLSAASHAHAQSISRRLTGSPKVPWRITADTVEYDAASATYYARGNVVIEKQATRLVADSAAFNRKAMTASAAGHVVLTVGGDVLTGERLELNLNKETGVVYDGSLFLKQNHFYIRGARIEKTGKDTYAAEKGSITTCDGDRPAWIITGRKVKVNVDGYGTATHAVFKADNLPVLYTPYLIFPAKSRRQSGLLTPEVGASNREGFTWDQPLYWAINDSSDATLDTRYMQKRGTMVGLEYRYALSDASLGAIMANGLKDRQIDNGTPSSTAQWGYSGDAYDRPNRDRYWLRAKADQELPGDAMAHLDLDIVSDQDYLVEFRDGPSGYDATQNYFLNTFGRGLDTYDETIRTNQLNINKIWPRYAFNGNLVWNDNVIARRWQETNDTLQQLPDIQFNAAKQQILGSGVYWDMDSEYDYFYRQDGDRGHRLDVYPRAYLPLMWRHYLSLEPSVGLRQTVWQMDRYADNTLDRTSYREIYDLELDLSTELSKIIQSPLASVDRIRHSIRPEVVYTYIPNQNQSDLPYFTGLDRIEAQNQITYSLTNTFTSRWAKNVPPRAVHPRKTGRGHEPPGSGDGLVNWAQKNSPAPQLYNYHRFCWFYLEQTYYISASGQDEPHPFSDIYGELQLSLSRYLALDADATYDPYESGFSSHNVSATLNDDRGDQLTVEHRYTKDLNESIRSTASFRMTDRLTMTGEYERNLLAGTDIVKGVGLLYTAQCWSFGARYSVEGQDKRVGFIVNLAGLGGFGH
jgi:LPS-assembly protein